MQKFTMIMAGGGGTRFWPLSRQNMPKQLLNLSGNDAMINETIKRLESIIPIDNTFIVTNKTQAKVMDRILIDRMPRENILIEPLARNTAPCILYAAMHIYEKFGDGILSVFPSDHLITDESKFLEILNNAINIADKTNKVITLGIKPTFAATGYGYIKRDEMLKESFAYNIDKFVEKPNLEKARKYINSGKYYWNSGMFVWKISVIIQLFERFLPRIYGKMKKMIGKFNDTNSIDYLEAIYSELDSISVDYGIMERIDEALVIPSDFGWNDVGSWDSLGSVFPADDNGNIIKADYIGYNSKECIIYGNNKIIAAVGMYNTIIVDTDDALLICSKDRAQDVKYIVDMLKEQGKLDLL